MYDLPHNILQYRRENSAEYLFLVSVLQDIERKIAFLLNYYLSSYNNFKTNTVLLLFVHFLLAWLNKTSEQCAETLAAILRMYSTSVV